MFKHVKHAEYSHLSDLILSAICSCLKASLYSPRNRFLNKSSETLLSQTQIVMTCSKHIVVVEAQMVPDVAINVFLYIKTILKIYTFKMYTFSFLPLAALTCAWITSKADD